MAESNAVFLEIIEWFDEAGKEVVHRIPESGSGDIKYGARLIVRESQAAVFFYNGKACDLFGPGSHTLETGNIPILTRILSLPWGFTSPLRAEVYFVDTKVFPNLKWGTRDPVAFKDSQLGLVRLRAFGVFSVRVAQPILLVNKLAGTQGVYTIEDLETYLSQVVVSRFNDLLGEKLDTIANLPGKYEAVAGALKQRLEQDFANYGLLLSELYINSITPPLDVQKAIDDKSRLGMFDDLNKLMQMKTAMAMEKAAESTSQAGIGVGMGLGFMMPSLFAGAPTGGAGAPNTSPCPDCARPVPAGSKFCPVCGHSLLVFDRCSGCGANLPPHARFCAACGKAAEEKPAPRICPHCRFENLPQSTYCNQCGEKLV